MRKIKVTTRQELLKLKRRLASVRFAQKLLEQKRDTLVNEFLKIKEKFLIKKKEVFEEAKEIIKLVEFSLNFHSVSLIDCLSLNPGSSFILESKDLSIMGVKSKVFSLSQFIPPKIIEETICPESFKDAILKFEKLLPKIVELSSLESLLNKLAKAIEKTRRRVNYLKEIIIPTLENEIKYLSQRLSDQERESFVFSLKLKRKREEMVSLT